MSQSNHLLVTVRGNQRRVYLGKKIDATHWYARTYVGSSPRKTVRGTLTVCSNGAMRFNPKGVNANLV